MVFSTAAERKSGHSSFTDVEIEDQRNDMVCPVHTFSKYNPGLLISNSLFLVIDFFNSKGGKHR